jgi:TatA/E family protein of Tat protein translocase
MIGQFGFAELLLLLVVVALVFGPRRLGEIGKSAGSALRVLRHSLTRPSGH